MYMRTINNEVLQTNLKRENILGAHVLTLRYMTRNAKI